MATCSDGTFSACACLSDDAQVSDGEPLADGSGSDGALLDGQPGTDATLDATTDVATDVTTGPITCQSDKECTASGQVCDPLTKFCVACLTDAECKVSEHCIGLTCQGYTPCSNSLGCKAAKGPDGLDQPICDQKIGECSSCLTAADCPASNDCVAKACVPFKTCQNSTECQKDEVCDKATNRCVQCLGNNDCATNQLCESGKCHGFVPCSSDKQCTQMGLLCDSSKGKCAQCLANGDCPGIYNCQKVGVDGTGFCVLDVCAQGQGACNNNQKVTCNSVGDGYGSPQTCGAGTTCVAPGGKPECKAWACTPGVSCDGDKLVTCTEDGLEVQKSEDCAASGGKCVAGACKPVICKPTESYCDGNVVKQCAADGLSGATTQTCKSSEFCDTGACKPQVCTPNQAGCDGNAVKTCNATGSGFLATAGTDCGAAKCFAGVCKALVCTPSDTYCDGKTVKACSVDGLSFTTVKTCGNSQFCAAGVCKAQVCTPGGSACDGSKPGTCNTDGSGVDTFGTDCATKNPAKVCVAGNCLAKICEPALQVCVGSSLNTCSPDGTAYSSTKACGVGYFCGANKLGDPACLPVVCDPGKATCNGTSSTTCNSDGSGYTGASTDCTSLTKVCSAGACVSLLCDPLNPLYCNGLDAMKCDATGLQPSKLQTCGAGYYCGSGACSKQICTPNSAASCAGNKPATCNADGSAYSTIGADCGVGKMCDAGVCLDQVCGNGIREGTEECDDGNKVDGDACSSSCSVDCSTLTLDGSGTQYVDIGSGGNYQFGTGDFTLEAMIRPTSTATGYILNRRVGDTYLGLTLNTGKVYFQCQVAGASSSFIGGAVQAGVWTHVAATRSSGVVTLWINGQAVATGTTTGFQKNFDVAAPFRLGMHPTTVAPEWNFVGDIALVAIDSGAKYTGSFTPSLLTATTCKGDCTLLNLSATAKMADTGTVGAALSLIGGAQISPSTSAPPWGPGKCAAVVCNANAASCLGKLAGQCNGDGTGLVSATDCAVSGKTCSAGLCLDQVCKPSLPYCDAGKVKLCAADGLSGLTTVTCSTSQYCDAASVTCKAQVCVPNAATCSGNKPATCNADGSGFVGVGADCGVGKACDPTSGTCKAQVCGNGVVEGTEECDDGNLAGGDACAPDCSSLGCESVWGAALLPAIPITASMTVEMWVKYTNAVRGSNTWMWRAYNTPECPNGIGTLFLQNSQLCAHGYVSQPNACGAAPSSDTWHHIAMQYSGSGTLLFADGKLLGQTGIPGGKLASCGALLNYWPGAGSQPDSIWFDSIRVSNTERYSAGGFTPGPLKVDSSALILSYFDEGAGQSAANVGVAGGAITFPSPLSWAGVCAQSSSVCVTNTSTCLGNLAGTCNAAGTGLVSATDCAVSGKTCSAGLCANKAAFSYKAVDQTFVVPANVTSVNVKLWGAGGGGDKAVGGGGGYAAGTLAVSPGDVLTVVVGQAGDLLHAANYGYGGGGWTSADGGAGGGSGGGRSAIRVNNGTEDVITAGGGGGGAHAATNVGGAGGGSTGVAGVGPAYGSGGTQASGGSGGAGTGGTAESGAKYQGGHSTNTWSGGGGGGGYYGGGGASGTTGSHGGGGGGSSWVGGAGVSGVAVVSGSGSTPGSSADVDYLAGVGVGALGAGGHGLVVISW